MYQNFVAPLTCTECGVTTNDSTSETQTGILTRGIEPPPLYLNVSDEFSMIKNGPVGAGYILVREPQQSQAIHLLQVWDCPACGRANLWAEIVLKRVDNSDGENRVVIDSIQSAELDLATLDRAHFISYHLTWSFKTITGEALEVDNKTRTDFMDLLRQNAQKTKDRI